jgi:hypothetical protein
MVPALRSTGSAALGCATDRSATDSPLCSPASDYGRVRLLVSVHHRLRLLASPMRTVVVLATRLRRPDTRPPSFRGDPFARDVLFDPGGTTMPRIRHRSCCVRPYAQSPLPRRNDFVAQSHTPCKRCVRFVFGIAAASRNTRFTGGPLRPYRKRHVQARMRG